MNHGVDESLYATRKSLRSVPGSLLLGSTGARLWADYLEAVPGFAGRFDFIHKVNIPHLFTVGNNLVSDFESCKAEWFPSHLRMHYTGDRLSFAEHKFITWDDCAVSCQAWTNRSDEALTLQLHTYGGAFQERSGNRLQGRFPIEHFSFDIEAAIAVSDAALLDGLRVEPGESVQFIVCAACGISGSDPATMLAERAAAYAESGRSGPQVLSDHAQVYQEWFDKAPAFHSSDPLLNKTWAYRWFVLRHNLAEPRYGLLPHPLFYEGRAHKKSKKPFSKGGWEFSKLINLSVPLHLTDARWHHDPAYGEGPLRNMKEAPDDSGMFCCLTVDTVMHSFANYSCWAAYRLYLVHRNTGAMTELLPALKRQIAAAHQVYGTDRDRLMIEYRHTRTGKEYQPSYWYFHNYPKNPKDKETYTHVKRVDRTVYHYLNTLGVARLCEELGDPEAKEYMDLAEGIKRDVLEKMWDESTQFFYDLHYMTDEKALVKNIVGFYPAWAQMLDDRYDGLMEHLFNRNEFATGCPFPSVSADCPVYSKEGGWQGFFLKGRNGCMWNGPTWPYTNSIALDALAKESKRRDHKYDRDFAHYLREYSFLHFLNRDLNQPCLVEHYNSGTGEPLSDEPEYNHSFYIDLVITHVAGLSVESDRIELDPVDIGLDYFVLDRVKAAGLDLRITYRKPGVRCSLPDVGEGYRVYANGRLVYSHDGLCAATLRLNDLQGERVVT
jgi:hypothetical protein